MITGGMRSCSNCGAAIASAAANCPRCGQPQMTAGRVGLYVVVALLVLGLVGVAGKWLIDRL